jgi:hypothetical protein
VGGFRTELFELLDVGRARVSVTPVDQPFLDQAGERFFERHGPVTACDRDLLMEVLKRVPPDVLARAIPDHQQLRSRHEAAALSR